MIKGYSFDIDTNGKEIDADYLVGVIEEALRLEGIELLSFIYEANWEDRNAYMHDIQCD